MSTNYIIQALQNGNEGEVLEGRSEMCFSVESHEIVTRLFLELSRFTLLKLEYIKLLCTSHKCRNHQVSFAETHFGKEEAKRI